MSQSSLDPRQKIRLLTYASPAYELRRQVLHLSARASGAVSETSSWNRSKVERSGFHKIAPSISLQERGGGWWAWKPFIINAELNRMNEGDWILYCDTGRIYPFKVIDRSLDILIEWTLRQLQFCMPGVKIPWKGPMSRWTKRDAFVLTGSDDSRCHEASPVQASFSLWRVCKESRGFVQQWLDWCCDRRLVSDDQNTCGLANAPDFVEHRHDQSLLTLLCLKRGIEGLEIGNRAPGYDEKNPSEVAATLGVKKSSSLALKLVQIAAKSAGALEVIPRKVMSNAELIGRHRG